MDAERREVLDEARHRGWIGLLPVGPKAVQAPQAF
jgi:hypothetical protein